MSRRDMLGFTTTVTRTTKMDFKYPLARNLRMGSKVFLSRRREMGSTATVARMGALGSNLWLVSVSRPNILIYMGRQSRGGHCCPLGEYCCSPLSTWGWFPPLLRAQFSKTFSQNHKAVLQLLVRPFPSLRLCHRRVERPRVTRLCILAWHRLRSGPGLLSSRSRLPRCPATCEAAGLAHSVRNGL